MCERARMDLVADSASLPQLRRLDAIPDYDVTRRRPLKLASPANDDCARFEGVRFSYSAHRLRGNQPSILLALFDISAKADTTTTAGLIIAPGRRYDSI